MTKKIEKMITNENLKTLRIYPLKNNYLIIGYSILFFSIIIVSVISLILLIKSEWHSIYFFLIVASVALIILYKKTIWKIKGYWEIELCESKIIIAKKNPLFITQKRYKFDSEDSLTMKNLKNLQFIKFFPLGKIYIEIIAKIDKTNWSVILENSEKEIINNLSENQANEILNFIKHK